MVDGQRSVDASPDCVSAQGEEGHHRSSLAEAKPRLQVKGNLFKGATVHSRQGGVETPQVHGAGIDVVGLV